jgi:hypothetical protein
MFDIHAHFVCAMPVRHRDRARRILMTAFSRTDLSDNPLRMAYGAANYAARASLNSADNRSLWIPEGMQPHLKALIAVGLRKITTDDHSRRSSN